MSMSLKADAVHIYLNSIKHADAFALEQLLTDEFTLQLPQPTAKERALSRPEAITFLTTVPGQKLMTDTFSFHVSESVETADRYVAEITFNAITNSGQRYSNLYIMWFKFKGARIYECRQFVDTAHAAASLS